MKKLWMRLRMRLRKKKMKTLFLSDDGVKTITVSGIANLRRSLTGLDGGALGGLVALLHLLVGQLRIGRSVGYGRGAGSRGRFSPMLDSSVLVLNRVYQPIHVTSVRRAVSLLYQGVARALEEAWARLRAGFAG